MIYKIWGEATIMGYYSRNLILNGDWNKIPTVVSRKSLPKVSELEINDRNIKFNNEMNDSQMYAFRTLLDIISVSNNYNYQLENCNYSLKIIDSNVKGIELLK